MPDFDATVALGAKGYSPQDAVAPLQAYFLAQQGKNLDTENQLNQLRLQQGQAGYNALQDYTNRMKAPGADPVAAATASGLAINPEAQSKSYQNAQAGNVLGALKSYSQTHDPNSLALAGPETVGQGATAQQTQAMTQGIDQDVEAKKVNLRGQIALGYMTAASKASTQGEQDAAWHAAVAQAHQSGLIPPLTAGHAIDNITDPGQRMTIARNWAAAGASSVVNSGDSMGNQTREKNLNDVYNVAPGTSLYAGPNLQNAMFNSTPAARQAPSPNAGRSVATDAPVPVAPAPGNGSRPIAGGFLGNGGGGGGAPAASAQPPLMSQAEQAFGLPTNYLGRTAQIESGGRANAKNASGAAGLFQFVPSTWARYAGQGQSPYDPQAATVAAARLAADNSATLTKALGRPPTGAELYLAHQQGGGGAAALLSNPNAPAASIVGAKAVISNGGTPNMTAGQFAGMWERKFNGQSGGNFNLSGPSQMGPGVAIPPAAEPSSLPGAGMVGLRAAAPVVPEAPAQPNLAPAVAGPIPLPSSAQPMPNTPEGRSASDSAPAPETRQLASGFTPLVHGLSLAEQAEQTSYGHLLGELPQQYATAATAAKQQNTTLDQMDADADKFRMGKFSDLQADIRSKVEALSKMVGATTPDLDSSLGAYQAFVKASGQIARQAASGISPNVGVGELSLISRSLPNPEMSRNGFNQVKAILQGSNDFTIAKQQAADKYESENHTLSGFEAEWTRNADPSAFWVRRMDPEDLRTMASNLQKSPEGRVQLKRMMTGMQWIKEQGLY